uniref:Peptidase S1 domain-containing protein n=1 Tax=Glossina brevipalpis TaxID=37001 RepID=A0A1A9W0A9_9MUSC
MRKSSVVSYNVQCTLLESLKSSIKGNGLWFMALLSLVNCAFVIGAPMKPEARIAGGIDSNINLFPWQVSVQCDGEHRCGGVIYSENVIITAAHCLFDVSSCDLKVRAGSSNWKSGGVLIKVNDFKIHIGYSSQTIVNDIALLHLSSTLAYSANIQPIELATTAPEDGDTAIVSGWGVTSDGASDIPTQLKSVELEIITRSRCASAAYSYGNDIKPSMICAAAPQKSACQRDSGGPLVSDGLLVGIVSWGWGCADPKYPGVFVDVAELYPWIVKFSVSFPDLR